MLISKTTHCFHCGAPGFGDERTINAQTPGCEILIERCEKCKSSKSTLIGTGWSREVIGAYDYKVRA